MLDLIMCIDDDPITLMLIKKVVHKASFSKEIINAQNGEEALVILDKLNNQNQETVLKPKLIFLDINMPVMGGWEFLDFFNASNYSDLNNIKVIILTSTIDPDDIKKAKTYPNVIDFQSKPITVEMLDVIKNKI